MTGRRTRPENPWDRRLDESDPAWQAFVKYRTLPPGERSYLKVAKDLSKSQTLISRWGNLYGWSDRVFEWDCFVDEQTRTAEIKAIREMREKHLNMASGFFAVVGIELNKLITMARQNTELVLSPDQIHRLGEFATRLERMNHDEPTSIIEQRANVSIDDRREFIQKVLTDDTIMGQLEALETEYNLKQLPPKNDENSLPPKNDENSSRPNEAPPGANFAEMTSADEG
jgi:hypothetical protein